MHFFKTFIHDCNDLSGFFLLLISLSIGSCATSLRSIKTEIECLHEDYDATHEAHEASYFRAEAKLGL
jgi:hypothetical protein